MTCSLFYHPCLKSTNVYHSLINYMILLQSFRDVVTSNVDVSEALTKLMFENIDPLYDFHCSLLAELEDRVAMW